MITLGIVGGIGSGKSFISSLFKELGAEIIKADEIGHLVLLLPEVQEKLKERWKDIDTTSRREVGRKVFNDLQELGFLEQVTLPYIVDHVKHYQAAGLLMNAEVMILDAPLLFECKLEGLCQGVIFVDTNYDKRLLNVTNRSYPMSEADWKIRESIQIDLDTKRGKSNFVIDNNGTLVETMVQVKSIWDSIQNKECRKVS